MSDSGEKINKNGMTTDPLQRLASIKPPRDLSLGGIKHNRKVFTPNLNVARNKNKGSAEVSSRSHRKDDKKRNNKFDKNKFVKNGPNIIKSGGVFSEGIGSAERHNSRVSYGRETDTSSSIRKPTLKLNDFTKVDNNLEEKRIRDAFGDETSYEEESEDFKTILDVEAPVKLPMDDGVEPVPKAVKIKQEMVVKTEPGDDALSIEPEPEVDKKPLLDVNEAFDNDVVHLLKNDKPTLLLMQFPDTLPGRGNGGDDDQPSTSTDKPVDERCRLKDLEEGKIGTLRIHKSGRVTIKLGDTIFEVNSGTKPSFYQEVVSMSVDDASRSAQIISLGQLTHKLNVTPQWETMFHNMAL